MAVAVTGSSYEGVEDPVKVVPYKMGYVPTNCGGLAIDSGLEKSANTEKSGGGYGLQYGSDLAIHLLWGGGGRKGCRNSATEGVFIPSD